MEAIVGFLFSDGFSVGVAILLLTVLGYVMFWPERPGSTPEFWREAEDRFAHIDGDVEVRWEEYDDGQVEWHVHAKNDRGGRVKERFLSEARILGREVVRDPSLPRRFPSAVFVDDANHWLNVVAGIVDASSVKGDGHTQGRHYVHGGVVNLVDASRVACVRLDEKSTKP